MRKRLGVLVLAALTVAGCDQFLTPPAGGDRSGRAETSPSPSASRAFAHSQTEDISGYYRPAGPIEASGVRLVQVFVAQEPAFVGWEAQPGGPYPPIGLELARDGRTITVSPQRYSVSDGRISLHGTAPGIGEVSLEARLDKDRLATARRNLGGAEEPAMTATVRIGSQTLSGVKLNWYGGD